MESNQTPAKKKNIAPFIIIPVVLVAGFFGVRAFLHSLNYESTDNAQIETNAVPVVSRLAGFIDSLSVSDYNEVRRDQLLVSIDDREYVLAVLQAETDLANARADLANAQAQLNNSVANKQVTLANEDVQSTRVQKATDDLKRDEGLFKDGAITQKQLGKNPGTFKEAIRSMGSRKTGRMRLQGL